MLRSHSFGVSVPWPPEHCFLSSLSFSLLLLTNALFPCSLIYFYNFELLLPLYVFMNPPFPELGVTCIFTWWFMKPLLSIRPCVKLTKKLCHDCSLPSLLPTERDGVRHGLSDEGQESMALWEVHIACRRPQRHRCLPHRRGSGNI